MCLNQYDSCLIILRYLIANDSKTFSSKKVAYCDIPTLVENDQKYKCTVELIDLVFICPVCRFQMKFFFICQMGYWLHALPELYFQKTKKVSTYAVFEGGGGVEVTELRQATNHFLFDFHMVTLCVFFFLNEFETFCLRSLRSLTE